MCATKQRALHQNTHTQATKTQGINCCLDAEEIICTQPNNMQNIVFCMHYLNQAHMSHKCKGKKSVQVTKHIWSRL